MRNIVEQFQHEDADDALCSKQRRNPAAQRHQNCRIEYRYGEHAARDIVRENHAWREALKALIQAGAGRIALGRGPAMMAENVCDTEMPVAHCGEHDEAEEPLGPVVPVDTLVRRQHPDTHVVTPTEIASAAKPAGPAVRAATTAQAMTANCTGTKRIGRSRNGRVSPISDGPWPRSATSSAAIKPPSRAATAKSGAQGRLSDTEQEST